MKPALIACSHGTNNPQGRAVIDGLRAEVARLRPGVEVLEAYVDVQEPALADVVAALPAGRTAVVVPLLLSVGFHTQVDIRAALRPGVTAAGPLGPDERLARVLQSRLEAAGAAAEDTVVLAAAGSSVAAAAASVAEMAGHLRRLRTGAVTVGYCSATAPLVDDAVAAARAPGVRVVLASYLLAPGYFHDLLAAAGADAVAAPLLPAGPLAQIVLDRYDQAVAAGQRL